MKFDQSTNRKISLAAGMLSAIASLVLSQGSIWGFEKLAGQISAALIAVTAILNLYFLGSTGQKISDERSRK